MMIILAFITDCNLIKHKGSVNYELCFSASKQKFFLGAFFGLIAILLAD